MKILANLRCNDMSPKMQMDTIFKRYMTFLRGWKGYDNTNNKRRDEQIGNWDD